MFRGFLAVGLLAFLPAVASGIGVEDIKITIRSFVDTYMTFLMKYKTERKQEMSKIDSVVSAFTVLITKALPSAKPALSIEDVKHKYGMYLCTNFGTMADLKTLEKSDKIHYDWHSDGSMDATFYYHVANLQVTIGVFYVETLMYSTTGNVTLTYKKNKIAIKMHVPHHNILLSNFAKDQCLLYVRHFDFVEIGGVEVDVQTDGMSGGQWTSSRLMEVVALYDKVLIDMMKREVLTELYYTLPIKPVCKHEDLNRQAEEYKADTGPRTYSDKFNKKCGKKWERTFVSTSNDKGVKVLDWAKHNLRF